ncbi:MAG: hypothetical protein HYU43_03930, partial [Armatimonadetes bacterium]|nr:hypothetical protein [Armatimonadota bacterium]
MDGQTVAIAEVDEWLSGGVGIMSEGCSACFDDVRVVSLEGYHENFAGRVFNTQPITLQGLEKGRLMVFGGPSWQDARCQVEPVSGRTGSYCILYGLSHPTTPGYLHIAQKGDHISLTLQRKKSDGVAVLGEARLDGLPSRIGIELNGRRVRVLADGQEALRAEDTEATGGRMGLAWKPSRYLPFQRVNAELPVESEAAPAVHPQFVQEATMQEWSTSQVARRVVTWNLSESSPGVLIDDTFSAAPVHWWVGRGSWNIIPRWPCDDRWSWLGGVASESPVLWTKYRLEGDVILDAWVAPFMDNPEDPVIGYSHPGNLNVTLCGDGRNLSSGYSFLFAARNNTTSQILRKEKVVAENRAICMVDPRRTNLAFQRHWFHLRIEKAGARLKYFVDGVQALEFMDSEPLSGGQAAFWSWQAGLMVARVRLSAQGAVVAVRPSIPALEAPEGTRGWKALRIPPGLACSFEKGTGGWESDNSTGEAEVGIRHEGPRPYLCVKNLVSGGAFRLQSPIQHYDSSRFPRLAFQFRADPGVRVNLQAKANGNPVVIPLTAGAEAGSEAAVLPAAAVSADGQWHAVRYDVAGALRARFPSIA